MRFQPLRIAQGVQLPALGLPVVVGHMVTRILGFGVASAVPVIRSGQHRIRVADSGWSGCGQLRGSDQQDRKTGSMTWKPRFDLRDLLEDETGDVPGWVLITLMTAGLVILIWGLAGPALSGVFDQAIGRVTGF